MKKQKKKKKKFKVYHPCPVLKVEFEIKNFKKNVYNLIAEL